jgi:GT2 family glycosyltransferase
MLVHTNSDRTISVAILSYNRRDELHRTLTELYRTREFWHEIVVADNGSTDGTPAMVHSNFPGVRLLETGANLGIVGSNRAYESTTSEWVLSLDDDSAPVVESLEPLLAILPKNGNIAAIALSIRRNWSQSISATLPISLSPAFGFSSAGVLFNRKALIEVGVYDPELFLFTNELHWTARAILANWEIAKADSSCVIHRSAPANRSSSLHAFQYTRNMLLFILRYVPATLTHAFVTRLVQRAVAYTIFHRTFVYILAVREAFSLHRRLTRKRCPLDELTLARINPDWRSGFSFLG